ncbi:MAG: rod-binding protein [Gemmatimonadota bacterium]|nr:rod-binding protein [Gemmatimonadota bacterium]
MTRIDAPSAAHQPDATDRLARLKDSSAKLEGLFVEQLFKAMRETVPQDGLTSGGQGEEIFSSLLDQKLADEVPAQWQRGITSALVKELRGSVPPEVK